MTTITVSASQTEELGAKLAQTVSGKPLLFIAMYGDLGAGKTVFIRGMASVLSPASKVKSPTYTLVNEYRRGETPLFHFDLYRLEGENDLDSFGFEEYVRSGNCIVEWSEKLGSCIPDNAIKVIIEKIDENTRRITIDGADFCPEDIL